MTLLGIYVAVVLPLLVLGVGYAAVRWNERDLKRRDRLRPGE